MKYGAHCHRLRFIQNSCGTKFDNIAQWIYLRMAYLKPHSYFVNYNSSFHLNMSFHFWWRFFLVTVTVKVCNAGAQKTD